MHYKVYEDKEIIIIVAVIKVMIIGGFCEVSTGRGKKKVRTSFTIGSTES